MTTLHGMAPRKVYEDLPDNLTFDISRGRFRYRNPLTGKRSYIGADEKEAIELAQKTNLVVELKQRERSLVPTFGDVVDKMLTDWIHTQPWSDNYRKIVVTRLNAIKNEWNDLTFNEITRKKIGAWLRARSTNGQTYNKWRDLFIHIWSVAITEELVDYNEAAATLKMSTSKKLECNQKKRKRLTSEAFWIIHDHKDTPPYLQIAMQQSLITLQSRQQIVNTLFSDYKDDGYLYYIRQKTARDTDMAFIKIAINEELDKIRRRAMDELASPYLVHRRPQRKDPEKIKQKPHWTYVYPGELGTAFAKARKASGLFDDWKAEERPTFHEIRSLGGRLYRAEGYPDAYIQSLMTHTDMKTTEIYLTDPGKLKPEHFRKVEASMTLSRARQIEP